MRFARESFAIETPFFVARQADSPESLEFPMRANHAAKVAKPYAQRIFCVWSALFLDLASQTPRARGGGRPLFAESEGAPNPPKAGGQSRDDLAVERLP